MRRKLKDLTVESVLVALGKPILTCEECGEVFVGRADARFCTDRCSGRSRQRRKRRRDKR